MIHVEVGCQSHLTYMQKTQGICIIVSIITVITEH